MKEPIFYKDNTVFIVHDNEAFIATIVNVLPTFTHDAYRYEVVMSGNIRTIKNEDEIFLTKKDAQFSIMPEWEKKLREKYKSLPDGKVYIVKVNETVSFQTDREGMIEHVVEIERGDLALNEALLQEAREHFPNPENKQ